MNDSITKNSDAYESSTTGGNAGSMGVEAGSMGAEVHTSTDAPTDALADAPVESLTHALADAPVESLSEPLTHALAESLTHAPIEMLSDSLVEALEVSDVYDGFYLRLEELSDAANRFFLGSSAVVGSSLAYDETSSQLVTNTGEELAAISAQEAKRLSAHASRDWTIKVLINTVYYRAQDKRGLADVAFICWGPQSDESDAALTAFSEGIAERFALGERAELMLNPDQFQRVLESKGRWCFTPEIKREPFEKGVVVFKSRRSLAERLTGYALEHRLGCNVLAILTWIVILGVLITLIWFFFFRS